MLRLTLLLVVLGLPGCWGSNTGNVIEVDVDAAQDSLKRSLDGWKEGKKPEEMGQSTPSISFNDLDWSHGVKLLDYEIVSADETRGPGLVAVVKLKMKKTGGQIAETTAKYIVNTNEAQVSVFRIKMKMM